jgi:hypothetical protein
MTPHFEDIMGRKRKAKPVTLARPGTEIAQATVPDPYNPERPSVVTKNIRTHPLDHMLARGRLTEAQKTAGDRFLALWDRSHTGGMRALDPTRVKVDVSFVPTGVDDRAMAAVRELERVCGSVGKRAYVLLARVIGLRMGFWDMARRPDASVDQAEAEHLAWAFRGALDDLTEFFGVARGKAREAAAYQREVKPLVGKIEVVRVEAEEG